MHSDPAPVAVGARGRNSRRRWRRRLARPTPAGRCGRARGRRRRGAGVRNTEPPTRCSGAGPRRSRAALANWMRPSREQTMIRSRECWMIARNRCSLSSRVPSSRRIRGLMATAGSGRSAPGLYASSRRRPSGAAAAQPGSAGLRCAARNFNGFGVGDGWARWFAGPDASLNFVRGSRLREPAAVRPRLPEEFHATSLVHVALLSAPILVTNRCSCCRRWCPRGGRQPRRPAAALATRPAGRSEPGAEEDLPGRAEAGLGTTHREHFPSRYVGWPARRSRAVEPRCASQGFSGLPPKNRRSSRMGLTDFTMRDGTAVIYYQTHRTMLPTAPQSTNASTSSHVWVREGTD